MNINKYIIAIILLTISLFGCKSDNNQPENFLAPSINLLESGDKTLVALNNDKVTEPKNGIEVTIFSGEVMKVNLDEKEIPDDFDMEYLDMEQLVLNLNLEITNNSEKTIDQDLLPVTVLTSNGELVTYLIFHDRLDVKLSTNRTIVANIVTSIPKDEKVLGILIHFEEDIKIYYPLEISDSENQYALLINAHLENVPDNLKAPMRAEVGDVGIVLESEDNYLLVDFIKPQGDMPNDWSFAKGYVPKSHVIFNPSDEDLREFSNVVRLEGNEILTDSVTNESFTYEVERYAKILKSENDRVLISMPGGANDAWVSMDDVDYNLEYFKGNPE